MYILIDVSRIMQDLNNRVNLAIVCECCKQQFYCVTLISLFRLNELCECESHHKDLFITWAATQSVHDRDCRDRFFVKIESMLILQCCFNIVSYKSCSNVYIFSLPFYKNSAWNVVFNIQLTVLTTLKQQLTLFQPHFNKVSRIPAGNTLLSKEWEILLEGIHVGKSDKREGKVHGVLRKRRSKAQSTLPLVLSRWPLCHVGSCTPGPGVPCQ